MAIKAQNVNMCWRAHREPTHTATDSKNEFSIYSKSSVMIKGVVFTPDVAALSLILYYEPDLQKIWTIFSEMQ